MKKQSLSISVPEPCHENWAEMTPVEKGRHCQSCQKTVIDFTRMPKVKIAEFIAQQNGSACGRFTSDQLNVELLPPKPTRSWMKYAAILLGLAPALGYGQEVKVPQSHGLEMSMSSITGYIDNSTKGIVIRKNMPSHESTNAKKQSKHIFPKVLKGQVIDINSGEPIIFGTVAIYKNDVLITGVETDLDGKFSIEVPRGADIEATYIGYEPKRINFKDIRFHEEFQIALKEGVLMDAVEIVGFYVTNDAKKDCAPKISVQDIEHSRSKKENEENPKYIFSTVEIVATRKIITQGLIECGSTITKKAI